MGLSDQCSFKYLKGAHFSVGYDVDMFSVVTVY